MSITKAVILETNCEIGFFAKCPGIHLNYKNMIYLHIQGGSQGYDTDDGNIGRYGDIHACIDGNNNFRMKPIDHLGIMSIYDLHYGNTWSCCK